MGEWIVKMWCIYTIVYYSAIKNKDIMSFSGNGWDYKIILGEITHTQKDMHGIYSLISAI